MNSLTTQVVVIGGGATGVSAALALASLGVRTVLVERRDFAAGTSGRNHGLLHSGARYAVKDPQAALECWPENQRVRRLFPEVVDPCGGLFVALSEEEEGYLAQLERSLAALGIPASRLTGEAVRQMEPAISMAARAAVTVPDGAVDPFRLVYAIASWAAARGAHLMPGRKVVELRAPSQRGGRWHVELDSGMIVESDVVVDAAGPWAAQVASLAGVRVPLVLSAGSLLVYQSRPTRRVINRARPPADGDILVPGGPVLVAGTTARFVAPDDPALLDPPGLRVEAAEVGLLRAEAEALLPILNTLRLLRAFAGVRALAGSVEPRPSDGSEPKRMSEPMSGLSQDPAQATAPKLVPGELHGREQGQKQEPGQNATPLARAQTRDFRVFTPAELNAPEGFFAVVGGKLTTSLLMGEACARKIAPLVGVAAPATPWLGQDGGTQARRAFVVPIPGRPWWRFSRQGSDGGQDAERTIVCECEWVPRDELVAELRASFYRDGFAGARRRLRLGMGGCQGTHCSLALPGIAWEAAHGADNGAGNDVVTRVWDAWSDFVRSRWAGVAAVGIRGLMTGEGQAAPITVEETLRGAAEQAEEAFLIYTELFGIPPERYGFAADGLPDPNQIYRHTGAERRTNEPPDVASDRAKVNRKESDGTKIAG